MSFKWSDENNEHGYKGQVFSTDGEVGVGQHGSMSKYEMNNLLICYGKVSEKANVFCRLQVTWIFCRLY